ncbi:MAG: hypothetical protein K9H16_01515 [Bacteroidales bacterium]|nr:hypothetical protein [Bacteroidales bacterium]
MFRNFFFLLSIFLFSNSISSFSQTCSFRLDAVDGLNITLDSCWKYHPGDDTTWAAFDYPDENWDTISTILKLNQVEENYFPGIGWFRLHLSIDSSLMDKTYILLMRHNGASEVYHNGELVARNGKLGLGFEDKRYIDPINIPIPIYLNNNQDQVIAVRYANEDASVIYKKYKLAPAGFSLNLTDRSTINQVMLGTNIGINVIVLLFTIFLVLGSLHFLIFLFFPENQSNLYYGTFALFFALIVLASFFQQSPIFTPSFVISYGYYIEMFTPFEFVFLMLLVYNLFYSKIHPFIWVVAGVSVGITALSFFNIPWKNIVFGIMLAFTFIEIFRVVIRAMIKKLNGAWIVGTGILIFILMVSTMILLAIWMGSNVVQGSGPYALLISFLMILAVISIPLSMSVYLARDFAITNKNLKVQLNTVKVLSAKTIEQEKEKQKILSGQKEILEHQVKERTAELESEKEKTEQLLLNTLPLKVVNELKLNGISEPESFENVTVYFSDIVGFTNISTQLEPAALIAELNEMFTAFDDIMERNHCERIKTIGDAYLAVCGMPDKHENHAELMAKSAIEICTYLDQRNQNSKIQWRIRIGLHSGKVVGGIVGVKKYIYDVFGDTINTTSRMESNSEPMRINVSETTYHLLADKFEFTPRQPMEIKGKGLMCMYFLER